MVQFYSCFKFYFILFWDVVLCMIMSLKQRKIKFKPRIKLKISLNCTSRNKSFSMWNVIQVNCGQKSNVRAVSYFWNSSFLIFYILGSGLAHLCLHMTELPVLGQEWYTDIGLDGGGGWGAIPQVLLLVINPVL